MDLRASDLERERVTTFLRDHCLEGRLEPDELDERTALALRARTQGELRDLVADLPGGAAVVSSAVGFTPPAPAPRRYGALSVVLGASVFLLALVLFAPVLAHPEFALVLGLGLVVLLVFAFLALVSLAPWLAAGAGAVWAIQKLREGRHRLEPPEPGGSAPTALR